MKQMKLKHLLLLALCVIPAIGYGQNNGDNQVRVESADCNSYNKVLKQGMIIHFAFRGKVTSTPIPQFQ